MASGVIGIGFGDTIYFNAIEQIGVRKALLQCADACITALIAFVFLQETLSLLSWVGILITIAGIAWVITDQTGERNGKKDLSCARLNLWHSFYNHKCNRARFSPEQRWHKTEVSALQSMILRLAAGMVSDPFLGFPEK